RSQPPTLALTDAQAARRESRDQFSVAHGHGACGDEGVPTLLGHVVVVAIEAALRQTLGARERVQLVERLVAHEVSPQPIVRWPHRLVYEHGHARSLRGRPVRPGFAASTVVGYY